MAEFDKMSNFAQKLHFSYKRKIVREKQTQNKQKNKNDQMICLQVTTSNFKNMYSYEKNEFKNKFIDFNIPF